MTSWSSGTTSSEEISEEAGEPRRYPRREKIRNLVMKSGMRKKQKNFCTRTDSQNKPDVIEVLFEQTSIASKFDQCSHGILSDYTCSDCCYMKWMEDLVAVRPKEQTEGKNKILEHRGNLDNIKNMVKKKATNVREVIDLTEENSGSNVKDLSVILKRAFCLLRFLLA